MDHSKILTQCIESVIKEGGSDLHISEGRQPIIRVSGGLVPLLTTPVCTHADIVAFLDILLTKELKAKFLENKEVDFSYGGTEKGRFRGNAFYQRGAIGIALRLIPTNIRTLPELGLPPVLAEFAHKKQGFFLVVGPVGQGKTTTLASLINLINQERTEHIVTIEDPIEYMYPAGKSIIDQREVGMDTADFHTALKSVLRQDVNVILLGEMRNMETMSAAVTAAETGHMVFSTLHTNNAAQTIDRIIDTFPADQQSQIRVQLAESLVGVFSQRLVRGISGGRVPAFELLINNPAVSNLIRERRTHEINSVIETGLDQGMIDMNRCLAEHVRAGRISVEEAMLHSFNPKNLERLL